MNGNSASLLRAIRGPVTLITVGVLFALNNFTQYRFEQTWPVILIVFGLLSLLRRGVQPPAPEPGAPGYGWPPPPAAYSSGGYRQSNYQGVTPPTTPAVSNEPKTPPSGGEA